MAALPMNKSTENGQAAILAVAAGSAVEIGSEWKRPNGAVVKVTAERMFRGQREVELSPVSGGGRKSWKWDRAVEYSLKPNTQSSATPNNGH